MKYEILLPDGYLKQELPGLNNWVKALRSRQYPRIVGRLCDGAGYCCLGVLSKVQNRLQKYNNDWVDGDTKSPYFLAPDNPAYRSLTREGEFAWGVKVAKGMHLYYNLRHCNDSGNFTFSEIADIIETLWQDSKNNL